MEYQFNMKKLGQKSSFKQMNSYLTFVGLSAILLSLSKCSPIIKILLAAGALQHTGLNEVILTYSTKELKQVDGKFNESDLQLKKIEIDFSLGVVEGLSKLNQEFFTSQNRKINLDQNQNKFLASLFQYQYKQVSQSNDRQSIQNKQTLKKFTVRKLEFNRSQYQYETNKNRNQDELRRLYYSQVKKVENDLNVFIHIDDYIENMASQLTNQFNASANLLTQELQPFFEIHEIFNQQADFVNLIFDIPKFQELNQIFEKQEEDMKSKQKQDAAQDKKKSEEELKVQVSEKDQIKEEEEQKNPLEYEISELKEEQQEDNDDSIPDIDQEEKKEV